MEERAATGVAVATVEAQTAPGLPGYGHPSFKGTFHLKLDATGRVALPAALKGAFGAQCVLRPHRNEYLNLWTPLGFDEFLKAFVASRPVGVVGPRTRKRLHMSATESAVDKQSRFVIPPDLRAQAGLGERIVLAGSIETIEIWPAETFEAEEATFDEADLFLDAFEGL